jgi:hypothetical protein
MKTCTKCQQTKDLSEFSIDKSRGFRLHSWCRECLREKNRQIYSRLDSAGKRRNRTNMEKREALKAVMANRAGGSCSTCGYNKCMGALEFHHTKDKDAEIATLLIKAAIGGGDYMERLETELTKCVLLCANCHREVHMSA